jgi:hypothetical protein
VHIENFMCHGRKIWEYFAREKTTRTPMQFIPQVCHRVTSGSSIMPKSNWNTK